MTRCLSRAFPRRTAWPPPAPAVVPGLILVALLLGLVAWSVAALQPPAPKPADAPADEFSAERAFEHVQQIAAQTHVAGSAAGGRVVTDSSPPSAGSGSTPASRTRWVPTTSRAARPRWHASATSSASCPGSDSTGRLYLMAHHDSVETGPGGNDDAAGVSTLLETVRALTAGPQLRNDVVVVLTDAEEACLCGAEAFAASHPLAAGGGVALNFEARGTTGPPIMFETSRGNAALAGAFAAAAPHPVATSFAVEVYRALPNDTDFSVLLADGGFTGLNTAYIDGAAAYHTPQDLPERMDRASCRRYGRQRSRRSPGRSATATWPPLATPSAEDATYFPLLDRLVRYPGGCLAARGCGARRRRRPGVVAAPAGDQLAAPHGRRHRARPAAARRWPRSPRRGCGRCWSLIRPGYAGCSIRGGRAGSGWPPSPSSPRSCCSGTRCCAGGSAPRRSPPAASSGWPSSPLSLPQWRPAAPTWRPGRRWPGPSPGIVAATTDNRAVRLGAALVGGAVAVVVLAPTAALFFPALGMRTAMAGGFVAALLAVALLPAFDLLFPDEDSRSGWLSTAVVPGIAVVLAVACAAVGLSVDRFDAAHPVPSQLAYALDRDTGQAWWASTESSPGAYTAQYVGRRGTLPLDLPYLAGKEMALGDAQPADLPAPQVTTVSDDVVGGRRQITVRVTPQRSGVRLLGLDLSVDGGTVVRAQLAGRAVPDEALGSDSPAHHLPRAPGRRSAGHLHRRRRRAGRPAGHRWQRRPGRPTRLPAAAGRRRRGRYAQLRPGAGQRHHATGLGAQVGGAVHVHDGAAGEPRRRRGQPDHRRRDLLGTGDPAEG